MGGYRMVRDLWSQWPARAAVSLLLISGMPLLVYAAWAAAGEGFLGTAYAQEASPLPRVRLDFSEAARDRGEEVFLVICNGCHGLKFVRDEETRRPIPPKIDAKAA